MSHQQPYSGYKVYGKLVLTGDTYKRATIRTSSNLVHFLFCRCQHNLNISCYGSYNPPDYKGWFRRKGQYFGR
jgi:hypothetical protein